MATVASRITNTGVQYTTGNSTVGILDEFTGAPVVDGNLQIWLDAAQTASYPGTGTNLYDLGKYGYTVALNGGLTWSQANGGYFTLSGASSQKITTNYVQTSVTAYTISLWFNTTQIPSGQSVLVQDRGNTGTGLSLTLGLGNPAGFAQPGAGLVYFVVDSTSIIAGIQTTAAFNDGAWHHVAAVFNRASGTVNSATDFQIYIDGVAQTVTNFSFNPPAVPLTGFGGTVIGYHDYWGVYFQGNISEVQIYNRTLSANEVVTNYNALASRYTKAPVTATQMTVGSKTQQSGTILVNGTFDEVSNFGGAVPRRVTNTGNLLVSGGFDEVTGMLVTNGMIAYIDAGKLESYPGTGTVITDLVNPMSNPTKIVGSIPWVNSSTASYWNFATASDSNYIQSTLAQNYVDLTMVFYPDFTDNQGFATTVGTGAGSSYDYSLRFAPVYAGTPWTLPNAGNNNDWANSATTYYVNGVAYTSTFTLPAGWLVLSGYRTNTVGNFASPFAYFFGVGYPLRAFQGRLAALVLYNRALTQQEHINNYNYFATRFGLATIGM